MDEYLPSLPDANAAPIATTPPTVAATQVDEPRRRFVPLVLFLFTCCATCFVGGVWSERVPGGGWVLHGSWRDGLTYMVAVMSILLAHEMGHFLQAVRHGVPASWPYFIPMPLTPIGTMGAVIGMGSKANRRQLFDIGISGPLAGLFVAVPVACYGVLVAEPYSAGPQAEVVARDPLVFQMLIRWLRPELVTAIDWSAMPSGLEGWGWAVNRWSEGVPTFAWNPYYMAAWVGMLITGLNMMPISQLDGGHISYALFGRRAHTVARVVVAMAFAFAVTGEHYNWLVMLFLVILMGVDHPPTSDDRVELGFWRKLIGAPSLIIPVLCLAPVPLVEV